MLHCQRFDSQEYYIKLNPITKQKAAITISGTSVLLVIRCKLQSMAHRTIFYIHKMNSQLKERRHHSSLDTGQRHPKQSAEASISSLELQDSMTVILFSWED
jgi:hypothetical protein